VHASVLAESGLTTETASLLSGPPLQGARVFRELDAVAPSPARLLPEPLVRGPRAAGSGGPPGRRRLRPPVRADVAPRPAHSAADLDILVAAVEDLATAVGAHDRRLGKVERTAVRRSPTPPRRPVRRRGRAVAGARRRMAQPDPETAAAELIAWVDWLRRHYQLTDRLPDTWRNDPAIVAELSALRHACDRLDREFSDR
jgi:hypothetical protein